MKKSLKITLYVIGAIALVVVGMLIFGHLVASWFAELFWKILGHWS